MHIRQLRMRIRWLRIRIQRLRIHVLGACRCVLIPTAPPEFTIDSSLRSGKGTAVGYEISGAGVPFCPSPPFPSSPASGRGDETYGWANSRSPLHLSPTWLIISTAQSKSTIPLSLRFPPLREGNQALRFPLLAGGTCRRGSSSAVFCELWCGDRYKGTSVGFTVGEGYTLFVALTPSPSPTLWARGVGAHGSAPCVSPSPARRERGIKGVRAKDRARPRACAGRNRLYLRDSVLNRCTLISS
jgi:hypothetical protein